MTTGDVPIPITLVHNKDVNPDQNWKSGQKTGRAGQSGQESGQGHHPVPVPVPVPVLLIGYGSYGQPLSLEFRAELIYLLQQNWIIAYAHVRGGGEGGSEWHRSGKSDKKLSTFDDYYACGCHLIELGITSTGLLCGEGCSAGGLIMGVMAIEMDRADWTD